jgi:hypothetical protein
MIGNIYEMQNLKDYVVHPENPSSNFSKEFVIFKDGGPED